MSHYTFREKVFKNLSLSTDGSFANPIQNEVKSYLNKLGEPSSVVIHQDVLSVVPNSLRSRFNSRIHLYEVYCPSVTLEKERLEQMEERLAEEIKSQQAQQKEADQEVSVGIFGDDDFYVSNQLLNNGPSTSVASAKRKSTTPSEQPARKSSRLDFPLIHDETSQDVFDDEALDTAGESSSECPSNFSVKRKPRSKSSPKKVIVVSKGVTELLSCSFPKNLCNFFHF